MSQKVTPDGGQKGFAVGRGLLAAAETLNYNMGESHPDPYGSSSQQLSGGEGQDPNTQLPRRAGSNLGNTMKLFASLGLSPADLDVLAQVPEENISVETLPQLLMQLKNRKLESNRHVAGDLPSLSSDTSYRGDLGDMHGRQSTQSHASQGNFGYSSMQDVSGRGYEALDYGNSSRDRQYSDHYRGLGMGSSSTSDDILPRRMGAPSQGKIQDFLGVMPQMFPHVCSLCDFDVHSQMEWTQHTTGMLHAENRRLLLQLYPGWDPHMSSGRMSGSLSLDAKGRADGLLGTAPSSGLRQGAGMSWGSDAGMGMSRKTPFSMQPKIRSRVVVVKYNRKPVLSNLFALARPFGTIRKHLVLNKKAFLELQSHEQALAMSAHYRKKPAVLHGKEVHVYISQELLVIENTERPETRMVAEGTSPVVFFSNLPRETEKKMELLTIARRFGTVEKHLFLNDEAFVQMSSSVDAEMLVKYYTINSLSIGRRAIRLNICTKYKNLTVRPGKGDQLKPSRDEGSRKTSSSRSSHRTSSRSQRATRSRSKERSSDKGEETKSKKEDKDGEGSSDEVEGVVEAHSGDDEEQEQEEGTFNEASAVEEDNSTLETEEAVQEQTDPAISLESEDHATEPTEHDLHDAEDTDKPEQSQLEQEQEPQTGEPLETKMDQENTTEEHKDTEECKDAEGQDDVEHPETEADHENTQEDLSEPEDPDDSDFPENMDEFVTLDELAEEEEGERHDSKYRERSSRGRRRSGDYKVVNVVGFKRGYGFIDEILALAKPFGKVVRHLVLKVRPEAFLELSSEQEAKAMVRFYNGNVTPTVCGKAVRVHHSQAYQSIHNGKVVYIGEIPPFESSDSSLLKIAEPYGKVRRYFLNGIRNECFIEMEKGEDAEKFVEAAKKNPPKFQGKRLVVYLSRKYKQLKRGHRPPSPDSKDKRPSKRERSVEKTETKDSSPVKAKKDDEPPTKKVKEETSTSDKTEGVLEGEKDMGDQTVLDESEPGTKKENEENMETQTTAENEHCATTVTQKNQETTEASTVPAQSVKKPETTLATLGLHDPDVPVGVEFVKMGYYCRVCFLFYSNEDTAKKVHCSSQAHYDKVKKHLEKEKAKAESSGGKN